MGHFGDDEIAWCWNLIDPVFDAWRRVA